MSVKVMTDVWSGSAAKGNDRLVLLAIADHANDEDRTAWPSIDHLARKCRLSRRTIFRCVHNLESQGEIRLTRAVGGVNHYTVRDPGQIGTRVNPSPVPDCGGVPVPPVTPPPCQSDTQTIREPSRRKPSVSARTRGVPLPEPFELDDPMRAFADKAGVETAYEFGKFKDYHRARRTLHVDWVSAWRYWVRNALERAELRRG